MMRITFRRVGGLFSSRWSSVPVNGVESQLAQGRYSSESLAAVMSSGIK